MDEIVTKLTELPDWVYYAMLAIGGGGYAWSQGWLANLFTAIDDKIDLPDFLPDDEDDEDEEVDWDQQCFDALRLLLEDADAATCERYRKAVRSAADHFMNRNYDPEAESDE